MVLLISDFSPVKVGGTRLQRHERIFCVVFFLTMEYNVTVAYPGIFSGGGVQQIQLRKEDGDLGAVAP